MARIPRTRARPGETAAGASDSTFRPQFIGAGAVNITVSLFGKTDGIMRVEFSGAEIKVFFDEVLKIITTSALNQSDVVLGLDKATTGGSRIGEWDTLSFVNGRSRATATSRS